MAKKRSEKTRQSPPTHISGSPAQNHNRSLEGVPEDEACSWPDTFLPWRNTLFMAGAVVVLAAMVFGAAAVGGFTALKVMLAYALGLTFPHQVYSSNYDIALVIWAIGSVLFVGFIHPVFGIGLLLVVRPWLDGYTFPLDNVYFTWCIYLLCMLWVARIFRRRASCHTPAPVLIFAGLLLFLFSTARFSNQYFNTYQMLWLWLGYGMLFWLCLNGLRDRNALGVALGFILLAIGVQALFSILHLEYGLPALRRAVQNPAILRAYFHTDVMTPEMARRFMMNRAFGTMLYPNSLAALVLLGIPLALALCAVFFQPLRGVLKRMASIKETQTGRLERFVIMGLAILSGLVFFLFVQFVAFFPNEYVYKDQITPLYLQTAPLAAISLAIAAVSGMTSLYMLMRWGIRTWWFVIRFFMVLLLTPVLCCTLWLTYSRSALLALFAALVWAAVLLALTPERAALLVTKLPTLKRRIALLLILGIVFCCALLLVYIAQPDPAWAQAASPAGTTRPLNEVREEGITLSAREMVDPASFRLRLGYWRVTLSMIMDNLLTGVGMGNFAVAYPRYQYVGAGDVREAHNGFLQFFAEAGLPGGLLFAAFWAYLAAWGAWRIMREQRPATKWLLLGIYTSIIAFSLHAALDINFSHPSLMVFAMVYCGMFYAVAGSAQDVDKEQSGPPVKTSGVRLVLPMVLILVALAGFNGTLKLYSQQISLNRLRFLGLGDKQEMDFRMRTGVFLFKDMYEYGVARDHGTPPAELPQFPVALMRLIVNDLDLLEKGCRFYAPIPDSPGKFERLEKGVPIPDNGRLVVFRPWLVRNVGADEALKWLAEVERQDRRFPHSPELGMYMAKWYELYFTYAHGPYVDARRPEWIAAFLHWAEIMMKRNPYHPDMRFYYAHTLVRQAIEVPDVDTEALLERAEAEYDAMLRFSPTSPQHRFMYAGGLDHIVAYYERNNQPERAAVYKERAQRIRAEAVALDAEKRATFLYN